MADLLQKGSDWLEDMRTSHASRTVVYCRDGQEIEVTATVGATVFEVDNGYGAVEKFESRDFLILAVDLILPGSGGAVEPRPGDRIAETVGGESSVKNVYEMMAPGEEPAWRYSDPYRKTVRIHTKLVTGNR